MTGMNVCGVQFEKKVDGVRRIVLPSKLMSSEASNRAMEATFISIEKRWAFCVNAT
jgi:hypothetical protein